MSDREHLLDTDGPAAPPRQNGELVFTAPWESRVFAVTVALFEQGRFEWDEFRQRLIAAIARAEARGGEFHYYACWLDALQDLVAAKGICAPEALDDRTRAFAARPAGHDHSA